MTLKMYVARQHSGRVLVVSYCSSCKPSAPGPDDDVDSSDEFKQAAESLEDDEELKLFVLGDKSMYTKQHAYSF